MFQITKSCLVSDKYRMRSLWQTASKWHFCWHCQTPSWSERRLCTRGSATPGTVQMWSAFSQCGLCMIYILAEACVFVQSVMSTAVFNLSRKILVNTFPGVDSSIPHGTLVPRWQVSYLCQLYMISYFLVFWHFRLFPNLVWECGYSISVGV